MLGLYLEGVFRISGDRVAIAKIWNSFDTGTPLLRGSKHEVAGALKLCVDFTFTHVDLVFPSHRYLQNAPESLIPPSVFEPVLFADEGTLDSLLLGDSDLVAQSLSH